MLEYEYWRWEHKIEGVIFYSRNWIGSPGPWNPRWNFFRITQEEYEAAIS